MLLLTLLACPPSDKDTAGLDTADTADTAPACTFLPASDRLAFDPACVDGVCLGTPYGEVVPVWGEPLSCVDDGRRIACGWEGRVLDFSDCDDDGLPDADTSACDMYEQLLLLTNPWDGATAKGLGLGVEAACWAEALGGPGPWQFGGSRWVEVSITPEDGPVELIGVDWSFDE